ERHRQGTRSWGQGSPPRTRLALGPGGLRPGRREAVARDLTGRTPRGDGARRPLHAQGARSKRGEGGLSMRQTRPSRPLPPRGELTNVFEFEELARNVLPGEVFATVAGGDRAAFDRFTFRPRMMIPVPDMDLSVELFGAKHFTPILIGPVAEQREFHPDG